MFNRELTRQALPSRCIKFGKGDANKQLDSTDKGYVEQAQRATGVCLNSLQEKCLMTRIWGEPGSPRDGAGKPPGLWELSL